MRFLMIAVLTACAAAAPGARAQNLPMTVPLDSGRLVRLRLDDGTVVRGRLLQPLAPESPEVAFCRYPAPPCRSIDLPRAVRLESRLVADLEVQRGTRLWRGAAIGAGVGAVFGLLTGSLYNGLCDSYGCGQPIAIWMFTQALGTALWGALFGSQGVVWGPAP